MMKIVSDPDFVRNCNPASRSPFEPGPRTRAGLYRTKREALKYLGLAVLFGAVLWTATLIVYLIFSGKAHG